MVQILIDNVAVGSPQPLVNGAATFSISTSTISSGGHNVSAAYTGDSTFAGSKGTVLAPDGSLASVDIISTTKPDFSLTAPGSNPCVAAVTVPPGAVGTGVVFTVTPLNGFTGTVNMIATNDNLAGATYTFSVSPITISSSAASTTSFVITASSLTAALRDQIKGPSSPHQSRNTPWYAAGSGATLACMLLLTMPRRRRWGALLAVMLSVAAYGAIGCSTNTSTTGGGGGNPTNPTAAGTYEFTVTATSTTGNLVHSAMVVLTVP
jgi:hypothetical protein